MIKITKKQKDYLINNGCQWGTDITKTYSGHSTYYVCEKPKNLKLLAKYENEVIVESHVCM